MAEASQDRSKVGHIYGGSLVFIAVSAFILSLVLASYFGRNIIEPSSNLNWAVYHGGTGTFDKQLGERVDISWWAKFLSTYVTVYPGIDGISTFVLCSVSQGEIIMGYYYGNAIHDLEYSWKRLLVFRLLGAVPQLVGAAFIRDLTLM